MVQGRQVLLHYDFNTFSMSEWVIINTKWAIFKMSSLY
jgi:hypothetical protein